MKNRKNFLIVFALFALLCLGVGYAALTDTLVITGTAGGSTQNASDVEDETLFDLKYVTANNPVVNTEKANGSTLTATSVYTNDETATINISNMTVKNEKVVVTFIIENASSQDYDAEISVKLAFADGTDSSYYLDVNYSFKGDGGTLSAEHDEDKQTVIIKKGGTATITVEITMKDTLVQQGRFPEEFNETITVTLTGKHIDFASYSVLPYTWK